MRTMYDSTNPGAIPTTAAIVGGYVDGLYAWKPADWARFPDAIKVGIAVFESTNAGIVGDSEYLDMTPAGLVRWVRMRRAAGVDPTGYCSEGSFTRNGVEYGWAACKAAFAAAKVPEPHWIVAAYPGGGPAIPAGAIGHQWADPNTSGGDYDLSAVADYWPGVDQGGQMDWTDQIPFNRTPQNPTQTASVEMCIANADLYAGVAMNNSATLLQDTAAIKAQLATLAGALSTDEAAIVAAVQGVDGDLKAGITQLVTAFAAPAVDVKQFAAALAPALAALLPPETPPAVLGEAVVAALEAHLATTPTAGGTS